MGHDLWFGLEPGRKIQPFPSACGGTIPARFEIPTMKALDVWAENHDVSRSEAIRRLVELGLKVKPRCCV
jgi:hypothetical protein